MGALVIVESGIGKAIKYYRVKQNMTQENLAEGILSISYLSKIESGHIKPTEEIIDLLSKRLDVDTEHEKKLLDEDKLHEWFQQLLNKDVENAKQTYESYIKELVIFDDSYLFYLLQIYKLRYYLLIQDREKMNEQVATLKTLSRDFTRLEQFYWYKFYGDYFYIKQLNSDALDSYSKAEETLTLLKINEEEMYDLYMSIAIVANHLENIPISIEYTQYCLEHYRKKYDLQKCVECHVLLGLTYRFSKYYVKAEESYKTALDLSDQLNDDSLKRLCYQNIGMLKSLQGYSESAIKYYEQSYQLRVNESGSIKLVSVISLIKEYVKIGSMKEANTWMDTGLDIAKDMNPEDSVYVHEINVYKNIVRQNMNDAWFNYVKKEVLPYLNERKLYVKLNHYLAIIGDYLFENSKYKLASTYYKEANDVANKIL
ncbi:helix-turn-helix domain-containing protein [Halalkalibacillus halophilus]|uniref:helix-turn-helix domain-containing protein n=1 Tax=Halalkalibacillus halophilus TaxID=392827 RepID=UPI0003FB31C3|nr:helix-turn-helix domain-containing protein [Halalkalibacillus halophilus]